MTTPIYSPNEADDLGYTTRRSPYEEVRLIPRGTLGSLQRAGVRLFSTPTANQPGLVGFPSGDVVPFFEETLS